MSRHRGVQHLGLPGLRPSVADVGWHVLVLRRDDEQRRTRGLFYFNACPCFAHHPARLIPPMAEGVQDADLVCIRHCSTGGLEACLAPPCNHVVPGAALGRVSPGRRRQWVDQHQCIGRMRAGSRQQATQACTHKYPRARHALQLPKQLQRIVLEASGCQALRAGLKLNDMDQQAVRLQHRTPPVPFPRPATGAMHEQHRQPGGRQRRTCACGHAHDADSILLASGCHDWAVTITTPAQLPC